MALVKCIGCGNKISKKAKACPKCGEPAPKEHPVLYTLLACIIITVVVIIAIPSQPKEPMSDAEIRLRTKFTEFFIKNTDVIKDATWTADAVLAIGVYDDGTSRNGLAEYVCQELTDHGYKNRGIMVKVIDYGVLMREEKWVKLGKAHCL